MKRRIPGCVAVLILAGLVSGIVWDRSNPIVQTTHAAGGLPGTGGLSGTVAGPKPFQAAQVYIRNAERRMLYMVYTNKGKYRAVALFPGTYEVNVTTADLASETAKVVIKEGETAHVDLTLKSSDAVSGGRSVNTRAELLPYDEIYPPGPGRDIAQRTCVNCHGPNFLPSRRWTEAQWNEGLDLMFGRGGEKEAKRRSGTYLASTSEIARGMLSDADRAILVPYLVKNFGPDSKLRAVRFTKTMPIDESKIANSLHIEYYFPPDPPGQGTNAPEYKQWSRRGRWGQAVDFDSKGNVWVTDRGVPARIVKLDPRTAEMKQWEYPNPLGGAHDFFIDHDKDLIYVPEHAGSEPFGKKHINVFDIKAEKWTARHVADPENVIKTPDGSKWMQSADIDREGNIWVGWMNGSAFSRLDPRTSKVTVFPAPSWPMRFYGVTVDKDDNVWSPYYLDGRMAMLNAKTGKWTEFRPEGHGQIKRATVDAQGNVWVGIYASGTAVGKIVKFERNTHKMSYYDIPHENAMPYDMSPDPQGNLWIVDDGQGGTIIKFDPRTAEFTYYPSPQRSDKPKIEITKSGAMWYSPRMSSMPNVGFGVMFPDMDAITTLAAFPQAFGSAD